MGFLCFSLIEILDRHEVAGSVSVGQSQLQQEVVTIRHSFFFLLHLLHLLPWGNWGSISSSYAIWTNFLNDLSDTLNATKLTVCPSSDRDDGGATQRKSVLEMSRVKIEDGFIVMPNLLFANLFMVIGP